MPRYVLKKYDFLLIDKQQIIICLPLLNKDIWILLSANIIRLRHITIFYYATLTCNYYGASHKKVYTTDKVYQHIFGLKSTAENKTNICYFKSSIYNILEYSLGNIWLSVDLSKYKVRCVCAVRQPSPISVIGADLMVFIKGTRFLGWVSVWM